MTRVRQIGIGNCGRAKQVRRSLSHFWPRAESNLYAEAKRLVAGGYAAARFEQCGARRRTVYSITPQGRKALRLWIAEPGGAVSMESEPLLKVFYADQGSKAELLETIRAIGKAAEQEKAHIQAMAQEYRAGEGPFPERDRSLGMGQVRSYRCMGGARRCGG
jgi:DNA-binding PadR family transcriptional regulator